MNAKSIENLTEKATGSCKEIEFTCAFYDKCTLPKKDTLCYQFPDFTICTEYLAKRSKLLNEK